MDNVSQLMLVGGVLSNFWILAANSVDHQTCTHEGSGLEALMQVPSGLNTNDSISLEAELPNGFNFSAQGTTDIEEAQRFFDQMCKTGEVPAGIQAIAVTNE